MAEGGVRARRRPRICVAAAAIVAALMVFAAGWAARGASDSGWLAAVAARSAAEAAPISAASAPARVGDGTGTGALCDCKGAVGMLCSHDTRLARLRDVAARSQCAPRACRGDAVPEPLYQGGEWPSMQNKRETLAKSTMLAKAAPACAQGRERVYVDLGARTYDSSVGWFRKHYPGGAEYAVHAFDIEERFRAEHEAERVTFHRAGVSTSDGTLFLGAGEMKGLSGGGAGVPVPTLNISKWLLHELPRDAYVVVKLDVEGMEHEIVPQLLATGAACAIDELFVECHYARRGVREKDRTPKECDGVGQPERPCMKRDECVHMIDALRAAGVWAHDWT